MKDWQKEYEDLLKITHNLAMRADRRLLRIERDYSKRAEYASLPDYAYKNAITDIAVKWGGESKGKYRFDRNMPKVIEDGNVNWKESLRLLKAKTADINKFLSSASSSIGKTKTSTGVKAVYQKRAETVSKTLGVSVGWKDIADIFESNLYKKYAEMYDSSSVAKAIHAVNKAPKNIGDMVELLNSKNITRTSKKEVRKIKVSTKEKRAALRELMYKNGALSDDPIVNEIIKKMYTFGDLKGRQIAKLTFNNDEE